MSPFIKVGGLIMGFGAVVSGIFGMNLKNHVEVKLLWPGITENKISEVSKYQYWFQEAPWAFLIVCTSIVVAMIIFFLGFTKKWDFLLYRSCDLLGLQVLSSTITSITQVLPSIISINTQVLPVKSWHEQRSKLHSSQELLHIRRRPGVSCIQQEDWKGFLNHINNSLLNQSVNKQIWRTGRVQTGGGEDHGTEDHRQGVWVPLQGMVMKY